ncbi:MAG: class III poly(R)-hydroxyalkanoic acid synthase subunit PhaC [Candidatus Methanoperedens sp.]|nr:class III poly(R)-hydroxyalkanoic acid synthase subunit PhaC [Candidatus Methanoperedens sp.]
MMKAIDAIENYRKFIKAIGILLEPGDISVGTTPSEVVYTEDDMKLIHYIPVVEKPNPVPVLILYAFVNRYYILDLQPDKSVVKKLLDEGFDIYIIDWGYPSGADRYLTLDDYVNGYINNAVNKIRELSGMDKITLFGVCQGGTLSTMYASLYPEKVKNLITLVTPINFDTDKGLLHVWAKNLDVDKVVDNYGIVPGDFLNAGFLLTDPFRLMIDKYVGLFSRIECEPDDKECRLRNEETVKTFLRMEKWIFDSPDQAGEAFRQFIKDCYQKNLLIKNKLKLDGKEINLKNITMPLLNVMAETDHLVPNDASLPLNDAVSSEDKETMVFPTGHIGIFVGSKSQNVVVPSIAQWLKPRSYPEEPKPVPEESPKAYTEEPRPAIEEQEAHPEEPKSYPKRSRSYPEKRKSRKTRGKMVET